MQIFWLNNIFRVSALCFLSGQNHHKMFYTNIQMLNVTIFKRNANLFAVVSKLFIITANK